MMSNIGTIETPFNVHNVVNVPTVYLRAAPQVPGHSGR